MVDILLGWVIVTVSAGPCACPLGLILPVTTTCLYGEDLGCYPGGTPLIKRGSGHPVHTATAGGSVFGIVWRRSHFTVPGPQR